MTATQKRGRGGPKEPFRPDEAWIEAFDMQFRAPQFYERMKLFARSKARFLARRRVVDEYYIEEIVADVVADTLDGQIRWYPDRVDLEKHFLDAIQSRIRTDCKHASKFRHVDADGKGAEVDAALADARTHDEERAAERADARASLDALRELAGDDIELVRLIDGYRTGETERAGLLVITGLTKAQYKAARQRLLRLVQHLPEDLNPYAMRL